MKPTLRIVDAPSEIKRTPKPFAGDRASNEPKRLSAVRTYHEDRAAWRDHPDTLAAFRIAFDRGIAVVDLARAMRRPASTVLVATKRAGFQFGKRLKLADPLTLDALMALADAAVPLPELLRDRMVGIHAERQARFKRERRIEARKNDPTFRPLGKRNTPGVSGTARKASGATVSAVAKRDLVSTPSIPDSVPVAQPVRPRPAPVDSPTRAAIPAFALPSKLPSNPFAYAEAVNNARRYLESRHCAVRKVDRDAVFAKWTVTGFSGSFDNAELVQLAADLQARAAQ